MSPADAATYDELGRGYSAARRTDPRIAAHIEAALGEARTVLNVGAGTGSYEPGNRELTAVEPSAVMIAQRPEGAGRFWLTRDYLDNLEGLITSRYREEGFWRDELQSSLGEVELRPVPVPHDCVDGFYQAFWRRPDAYLDPGVRDGTSVFRMLPRARVDSAIRQLSRDLSDGAWEERYGDLLQQSELDVGLRLVVAGDPAA
jgi:hypothetical protein